MNKTIMMIHGMGVGGWIWGNYKEFFEQKGYQCLTPILRYHDRDPKVRRILSWEQPAFLTMRTILKMKSADLMKNQSSWDIPWAV